MIVWGGRPIVGGAFNTGGRYNPSTDTWVATSTANALAARYVHTAVWTGTEMIIWGGTPDESAFFFFNTGGRYNPATDSWTAASTTNAPTARYYHTAVWTGSEMIVWGGFNRINTFDTGGRYNPNTDTWVATNTSNAPLGRFWHTAEWTGFEMIIWGGYDGSYLNTGARYNPNTDSWTATSIANAPSGRSFHTAVWTDSEMVVWGGFGASNGFNTGGRYNPSTDIWIATTTVNAPEARSSHTAIWTGSEMIVWSGNYSDTGGRYNPDSDSWVNTGADNAPSARSDHMAVWIGTEMIIWGGSFVSNGWNLFNTGGRYNPATDSWIPTSITNAPDARSSHTAVWTGNEMIVWGGTSSTTEVNTGGRYNPLSDTWTATSTVNAPTARQNHTTVWTGNKMIVWGGYGCGGNCNLNSGGRYNPSTDSWTSTSTVNVPSARWEHIAVWTASEMIIWGGTDAIPNHTYLHTGGRYNPATDSWMPTSVINAPLGRVGHTAVWTGTEMIVWGGVDETFNDTNTGGRYNPSQDSWVATAIASVAAPRDSHTAVWTGSQMIVWGGFSPTGPPNANTGGRYNPTEDSWTSTSTVNAPFGRFDHTAVWTGNEMIVWGGSDTPEYLNSGGIYCAQSAPTPTPTPTTTPSATATPTPRMTPVPRNRPTPAPRP